MYLIHVSFAVWTEFSSTHHVFALPVKRSPFTSVLDEVVFIFRCPCDMWVDFLWNFVEHFLFQVLLWWTCRKRESHYTIWVHGWFKVLVPVFCFVWDHLRLFLWISCGCIKCSKFISFVIGFVHWPITQNKEQNSQYFSTQVVNSGYFPGRSGSCAKISYLFKSKLLTKVKSILKKKVSNCMHFSHSCLCLKEWGSTIQHYEIWTTIPL